MKTEPEIRAETTPMADKLDLDALEALMAYADPSAPIDHMAIYAALRDAAPALIAAARERDSFAAEMLQLRDEYALFRRDTRALLDNAEKALEPLANIICVASREGEPEHWAFDRYKDDQHVFSVGKDRIITAGDLRRARSTLAEIRNAKAAP